MSGEKCAFIQTYSKTLECPHGELDLRGNCGVVVLLEFLTTSGTVHSYLNSSLSSPHVSNCASFVCALSLYLYGLSCFNILYVTSTM